MDTSKIGYFTPVEWNNGKHNFADACDQYFSLFGKRTVKVINPESKNFQVTQKEAEKSNFPSKAGRFILAVLKITSIVTIIIPLIFAIGKAVNRSEKPFKYTKSDPAGITHEEIITNYDSINSDTKNKLETPYKEKIDKLNKNEDPTYFENLSNFDKFIIRKIAEKDGGFYNCLPNELASQPSSHYQTQFFKEPQTKPKPMKDPVVIPSKPKGSDQAGIIPRDEQMGIINNYDYINIDTKKELETHYKKLIENLKKNEDITYFASLSNFDKFIILKIAENDEGIYNDLPFYIINKDSSHYQTQFFEEPQT